MKHEKLPSNEKHSETFFFLLSGTFPKLPFSSVFEKRLQMV